jgi:citrate lyase subunit gamma (acyl carrier protein)
MMEIAKKAEAGTSETGDIHVTVIPVDQEGIHIQLESKKVILKQFGRQMEEVIRDTVLQLGVENILIKALDRGALDYTIRARVQTAIRRAV